MSKQKKKDNENEEFRFALIYLVYKKNKEYKGYAVVNCCEYLSGFSVRKHKKNQSKDKYYKLNDDTKKDLVAVIKNTSGKFENI